MKTRKILVCGSDKGLGGGQAAFRRFVEFLARENNVSLGVIPISGPCADDRSISLENAVLSRIESDRTLPRKAWSLYSAIKAASSFKPDIFVSIGLSRSANAIMSSLHKNTRGIAFDFIADRDPACPLLASSLEEFGEICVQSPSMVTRLLEAGLPASRLSWAPCFPGPDFPEFGKRGQSQLGDKLRLAYFGRLAANKGLPVYIRALAKLTNLQVQLDIWGSGPDGDNIRHSYEENGVAHMVLLRGRYPAGAEAVKLMAFYDAVVMPSQCLEGVPLVLIEAMAAGLPALCTDVGAMKDICDENPDFVLSAPDVDSLAANTLKMRNAIAAGKIDHSRLRASYQARFSEIAVGARWRSLLGLNQQADGEEQ